MILQINKALCPRADVSTARCVHGPLCQRPNVSIARYVHGRCVHGPLCPRAARGVHKYSNPNPNSNPEP